MPNLQQSRAPTGALGERLSLRYHGTEHGDVRAMSRHLRDQMSPALLSQQQEQDYALIRAIAAKDTRAFEQLYHRYAARIGRYLSRLLKQADLVEEVINDVLMVVWSSADQFDPARSRLSTWLLGIAHNKALKALARNSRHADAIALDPLADEDADPPVQIADPRTPESTVMGWQLGANLVWALDQLSPEHRGVIELAFVEECSYDEIARIQSCPVNTVKTRVFHARKRIAQLLAQRDQNNN